MHPAQEEGYVKILDVQSPGSFDSSLASPQAYLGILLLPEKSQLKSHLFLREKK